MLGWNKQNVGSLSISALATFLEYFSRMQIKTTGTYSLIDEKSNRDQKLSPLKLQAF